MLTAPTISCFQGFLRRHLLDDSPEPEGSILNTGLFRPLRQRLGSTLVGQCNAIASVVGLVYSVCPSAVFGTVRAIVVDSFHRKLRAGASAHVRVEVLERLDPSVTHVYASASVLGVGLTSLVEAPLTNTAPNVVLWRPSHTVSMMNVCSIVVMVASAAFGSTLLETGGTDGLLDPAIAQAPKPRRVIPASVETNDRELAKSLSSQILEVVCSFHDWIIPHEGCHAKPAVI